jgi:6,7-dimethyl-8-ribityllumazine synthase
MATTADNPALFTSENLPDTTGMCIGIVAAEWNGDITGELLAGALRVLEKTSCKYELLKVPGTFELTSGAFLMASRHKVDAVICLGCVIRGETPHFDYICQSVTNGLTTLNATSAVPFIFGVLTTNNLQQALDRIGGKHGHKGEEAAVTALKMAALKKSFATEGKIGFR